MNKIFNNFKIDIQRTNLNKGRFKTGYKGHGIIITDRFTKLMTRKNYFG